MTRGLLRLGCMSCLGGGGGKYRARAPEPYSESLTCWWGFGLGSGLTAARAYLLFLSVSSIPLALIGGGRQTRRPVRPSTLKKKGVFSRLRFLSSGVEDQLSWHSPSFYRSSPFPFACALFRLIMRGGPGSFFASTPHHETRGPIESSALTR